MRRIFWFLFFVFIFQQGFGSGHFRYEIRADGVYGGTYGLTKIEGADPKTFEFIDGTQSPWGLVVTYAKDKNRVYYYDIVIEGADPESFEKLEKWYVKDKNHVYNARNGHQIYENYDAPTFVILGNWFVKDKDGVYYQHNLSAEAIKIENADPGSFEILWGTDYLKDKNQVYYYQAKGYGEDLAIKVFEDVDPGMFVVDIPSSPYSRDAENVYWNGEKLIDANADTFKRIMKTSYATDGKNVYYQSTKLLDADAGKFRLENTDVGITDRYVYYHGIKLEGIHPDNFVLGSKYYPGYIKNDSVVYYRGTRVQEADAATFEVTGDLGREAKDKNYGYVEGKIDEKALIIYGIYESGVYYSNSGSMKADDADPKTFQILNEYYGKDKNAVYFTYSKVKNADVRTFEVINDFVGRDRRAVYHGKDKIAGADPKTYVSLNLRYGKDNKNVFYDDKVIRNIDLSSFEVINNFYAKDKNHVFFNNQIIKNSDPESIQVVEYPFCKDKNNVYFEDKVIENADPASFKTLKEAYKNYSKDKNHVYFKTSVVEDADPDTFEKYIGSDLWIDKNYVFHDGKKLENSDAPTFESLDGSYSRDKNNVYSYDKKLDVDMLTFRIISKYYAIDKNHVYSGGRIDNRYDVKTFHVKDTYY